MKLNTLKEAAELLLWKDAGGKLEFLYSNGEWKESACIFPDFRCHTYRKLEKPFVPEKGEMVLATKFGDYESLLDRTVVCMDGNAYICKCQAGYYKPYAKVKPVKPEPKQPREWFANEYPDGSIGGHTKEETARERAVPDVVNVVNVIKVREVL